MRRLLAEPGQGGFDAEKLINPPLVFVWIPVGIILIGITYCLLKCVWQAGKRKAPGGLKNVLYYPSDFEGNVDRVPHPQDDDRPLPRRTLARISHTSNASGMPASESNTGRDSSGTLLGITHAQLQKLQLADIANMLLPDRTASIQSQSGGLPFVTIGSQGSASVVQGETQSGEQAFGINDIFYDAHSGKQDLSAPLDHHVASPSPVSRRGLHTRNSLSHGGGPLDDSEGLYREHQGHSHPAARDSRHVFSPMQPQSMPSPANGGAESWKKVGKSPSMRSPGHRASHSLTATMDGRGPRFSTSSGYREDADRMDPVDIEL